MYNNERKISVFNQKNGLIFLIKITPLRNMFEMILSYFRDNHLGREVNLGNDARAEPGCLVVGIPKKKRTKLKVFLTIP